ncbi:hypothetical protein HAZT_HAZT002363 [Hyalella azteca]|uniref:Neurotransmitter-gated ion-channel ligand-binding domain-containing protein n=1 Tax=Hyalella azteca TaxID=294128 RepID=A0A6A0HE12_HYAAZ|nr:hypothetical protein HAZT_HAZT002363 [Hyalella azteca]
MTVKLFAGTRYHGEGVGASYLYAVPGPAWIVGLVVLAVLSNIGPTEAGSPDAKRLYDDLLSNYNKLVRPVVNVTDVLTVRIKLKLSQLIDVKISGNELDAYTCHETKRST